MTINDELNIHDDAFKNYLWVKLFDDDVFAIIKSHCSFYWATPKLVSFRGLIQNFRRASPPLLYESTPPPPGGEICSINRVKTREKTLTTFIPEMRRKVANGISLCNGKRCTCRV